MSLRRSRFPLPAAVLGLAIAAGGCAGGGVAGSVSDPLEILDRAVDRTAELRTAHVRFDLAAPDIAGIDGLRGEGDVNVENRGLVATIDLPPPEAGLELEVVYVDGVLFTRTGTGRWVRSGGAGSADPLAFLPTTAKIADAIGMALDDPAVASTFVGEETCGTTSCLHVSVTIPPEGVWRTSQRLTGLDGLNEPAPPGTAALPLEAWVAVDTLQLMRAEFAVPFGGSAVEVALDLSRHDEPVDLEPPPSSEVVAEE